MDKSSKKLKYWENRDINIGDYEKINIGFSFVEGTNEDSISIFESQERSITPNQSVTEISKEMVNLVKQTLDEREIQIRTRTADFVDKFDTLEKMPSKKISTDKKEFSYDESELQIEQINEEVKKEIPSRNRVLNSGNRRGRRNYGVRKRRDRS